MMTNTRYVDKAEQTLIDKMSGDIDRYHYFMDSFQIISTIILITIMEFDEISV